MNKIILKLIIISLLNKLNTGLWFKDIHIVLSYLNNKIIRTKHTKHKLFEEKTVLNDCINVLI